MNLQVGEELPDLIKRPTTRQLAQYAGAQGDFYEIHYDQDFARGVGLPGSSCMDSSKPPSSAS